MDFFTRLFDSTDFAPRWRCGNWSTELGWLHILSDLGIWSAYVAIPLVLGFFILRKKDLPFRKIFLLFGAFILACGTTHLMEAIIFWWPAYRLSGLIKLATAIISWATVIALIPLVPRVLAMRSPEELEREIAARKKADDALRFANEQLEIRVRDRTAELQRANTSLQIERERFRTTLSSIGDAVIATDTDGQVTFVNTVAQELTGWAMADALNQPLETIFRIVHETTRAQVENPALRALREGIIIGLANHTVLIARDGSERPIDDSAAPIRDDKGVVAGSVLVFRDITERKQTEIDHRIAEERFRRALDETAVPTLLHAEDDEILLVNRVFTEITGYRHDDVPTIRDWTERAYGERHATARENIDSLFAADQRVDNGEWVVRTAKGEERIWHFFSTPMGRDPNGRRVLVSNAIDVTEQNRSEAALRQSESQFRQMADAMPQVIWTAQPDGHIDYYNERWYEYTGFNRNEYSESHWAAILHPDDVQPTRDAYHSAIQSGSPYQMEYRWKDPARSGYRWFMGRALPARDEYGRIVRWIGTCTDVDDIKRAEQSLKESDRRKDEFLATLAHELRNPLAPIRNALAVLKISGDNRDVFTKSREMMERQLAQMVRLVDDLLDVSRISRGKIELKLAPVELASIIHHSIETSRPLAVTAGHAVRITLPEEPIYLHGDPVRLQQVFSNLLNNAYKFTPPGGQIHLTARRVGDEVTVSVHDNGIGIPPEKLDGIFEMFSQIDTSLERSQGGLGIGLNLVKRLVHLHNGDVEARSEGLGKGSEFLVRLTAIAAQPTIDPRPSDGHAAPPRRILIVDDNRDSAESLAMLMGLAGHETTICHDGLDAVDLAETWRPEILILDIGLPRLNGYEVCRRIRERDWGKSILILAMTGWGQDEDRRKSAEAGFNSHLVKPIDYNQVIDLIGKWSE